MGRKRNLELDMFGMQMSLTDKERVTITVDDRRRRSGGECMFFVVGRVLNAEPFKFEDFADNVKHSSGLGNEVEIIYLQEDRFLFRVFDESHKQLILNTRLWLIKGTLLKGSLLILNDVPENMNPLHVDLSCCSFYVHIHDLPLSMQTKKTAVMVANSIGVFEEYDVTATWGVSLRVRVKINVDQPLMRFLKIKSSPTGEEVVARFTYEDLPVYCYLCGYLDHSRRECDLGDKFDVKKRIDELPYGSWLHEKVQMPEMYCDTDFERKHGAGINGIKWVFQHMVGGSFKSRKKYNPGKMKIFLLLYSGCNLVFEVMRSEVIYHFKLMIADRERTHSKDDYILLHNGKWLEDSKTMSHYNIQENETIHLMFRQRGG